MCLDQRGVYCSCVLQECRGWQCCALCRSSRLGVATLRRARERQVAWRETNTPLHNNPVPVGSVCVWCVFDLCNHVMQIHLFPFCCFSAAAHWWLYIQAHPPHHKHTPTSLLTCPSFRHSPIPRIPFHSRHWTMRLTLSFNT